jgi:hypothetical protein
VLPGRGVRGVPGRPRRRAAIEGELLMLVQVLGALLILAAFTAAQFGHVDPQSRSYLVLNLVGSTVLTYDALHGREWGFFILEFVWALVSAWGLLRSTPNWSRTQSAR